MQKTTTVVLVVEDEVLLRMDAVQTMEDAGFKVFEAATADEAIAIIEAHQDINVIFTDIDMPGSMDGLKLAKAVRGRWPPIKIIVTSGKTIARQDDLPDGSIFIPKPYGSASITNTVRELMR